MQQSFQSPELSAQFTIQSAISGAVYERASQIFMPHINVPHRGESSAQMAVRRGLLRFQQLVGDSRQRADHDHCLRILSTLYYADETADRGSVFHRRAAELHHHHIVVSLESALSRSSAHIALSVRFVFAQRKTHRQIASGGGFG